MEISDLAGLPAHPLLVHLPVVLVPLMGVFAVVLVAVPRWRDRFLPVLVVGTGLAWVFSMLAAGSGESLEERVEETAALEDHAQLGEAAPWITLVFFVAVLAWWVWRRWGAERVGAERMAHTAAAVGLPVLVVLSGLVATGWMVQTGHSGADSVWEDVGTGDEGEDGEDDDEEEGLGAVPVSAATPPVG
jgi:uncharacterized membrane protein